jgi:DNA-binding MarR family transcriptional regulator
MEDIQQVKRLREMMRLLVRKLGFLERGEASCCQITISQCHTIVELGRAGKLSLIDLADSLNLDKSTVSRSVDNLVNQELVIREADLEDRRFVRLRLTERGQKIYQEIERRMENYFLEIIRTIPEDKREQVIESIDYLTKGIHRFNCC